MADAGFFMPLPTV